MEDVAPVVEKLIPNSSHLSIKMAVAVLMLEGSTRHVMSIRN